MQNILSLCHSYCFPSVSGGYDCSNASELLFLYQPGNEVVDLSHKLTYPLNQDYCSFLACYQLCEEMRNPFHVSPLHFWWLYVEEREFAYIRRKPGVGSHLFTNTLPRFTSLRAGSAVMFSVTQPCAQLCWALVPGLRFGHSPSSAVVFLLLAAPGAEPQDIAAHCYLPCS